MIRKLLCWLGYHDYIDCCNDGKCFARYGFINGDCYNCPYGHGHNIICKYCGKELIYNEKFKIEDWYDVERKDK